MKEIGGYIELDRYDRPMLHEGALALNCGRNALAWLLRARSVRRIRLPRFLCDSVRNTCAREGVDVSFYAVGDDLLPHVPPLAADEWLYVVNYYGQLTRPRIEALRQRYGRVIVDNAQAYFDAPLPGVDTLYTCRKFFGVPDGAFLYTDAVLPDPLPRDESFERMHFLLGRFERTASEFYAEYAANNDFFADEPIKRMSRLTDNLLRGIDYDAVRRRRTENFAYLSERLGEINRLSLSVPEGAFMYPLWLENGAALRRTLQAEKIYIPTLWPDVFTLCGEADTETDLARNILPLPVDQRYGRAEMDTVVRLLLRALD